MKTTFLFILILSSFITFSQESQLNQIDEIVKSIDSDSTLTQANFNWEVLAGITTGQLGSREIWHKGETLYKTVEKIKFIDFISVTTIYLRNGIPVKIIEKEENFKDGDKDSRPIEVFAATIYVFDWKNDESEIIRRGKRVFTEGGCSNFDYEPIVENAIKLIAE